MAELYELLGLTVKRDSADERSALLSDLGFHAVECVDHSADCLESDCERLRGVLKAQVVSLVGTIRYQVWLDIREAMFQAMSSRARAVHILPARGE